MTDSWKSDEITSHVPCISRDDGENNNILFTINKSDKAKNEDLSAQSQESTAEQFTKRCHLHARTDSDDQSDVDEAGNDDTDDTSIEPKDIELVTLQVSRSTSKAMTHGGKMRKNRRQGNTPDVE